MIVYLWLILLSIGGILYHTFIKPKMFNKKEIRDKGFSIIYSIILFSSIVKYF